MFQPCHKHVGLWLGQKLLWLVGVTWRFCKYKIEVLAPVPESLKSRSAMKLLLLQWLYRQQTRRFFVFFPHNVLADITVAGVT